MKNLFSIGEVSKIKGVTIKALRYYHKMGILIPRHIDNITGYRYYSDLDKIIQNEKVETLIERGILYNIDSKENIEPKYAFNVLKDNNIKRKEYIKVLPGGNYLTLAYTKENELECKRKIFDYIKEKNLEIKNFIEIDLLNDFFNTESYSCQIQMLLNYDKLI